MGRIMGGGRTSPGGLGCSSVGRCWASAGASEKVRKRERRTKVRQRLRRAPKQSLDRRYQQLRCWCAKDAIGRHTQGVSGNPAIRQSGVASCLVPGPPKAAAESSWRSNVVVGCQLEQALRNDQDVTGLQRDILAGLGIPHQVIEVNRNDRTLSALLTD